MRQTNLLLFLCLCLLACGRKAKVGDTVTVEPGVEIPIAACVEANQKYLGTSVDPVAFCKCLIPKFCQDLKNDPEKLKLLKEGNWYDLARDKQEVIEKYFAGCMSQAATNDSTAKFTVTPRMAVGMKNKMKSRALAVV